MTLRIYIAASSREVERVRAAQAAVAARGWTLTLDWLTPMLANIEAGRPDAALGDEEAAEYARADLAAIASADVLWLLAPTQPTKGAYVELGYALGTRRVPVVVSGPRTSIFEALGACVTTDAEAPEMIVRAVGWL